MNYSTNRFTLDLQKSQSQISVAAFRYDTAKKLVIVFTDGGIPFKFEAGIIAVLSGKKEDGSPILHECMIEGNTKVIYEFNSTTASIPGIIDCQIQFYKDGDRVLSAPKFIIVVSKRVVNDEDVFNAGDGSFEERFSALDDILTKESGRVIAENARVEAEKERVEKENERVEAEKERVEKENERVEAEKERQKVYSQIDVKKADKTEVESKITEVKTQLANKVDKTTKADRIYGTDATGKQITYGVSNLAKSASIVRRTLDGGVNVNPLPLEDSHATPKVYVDGKITEVKAHTDALAERVSDLESLTLTFTEDDSIAYEKSVPADVGSKALIKAIGGATQKVIGKNLINPRILTIGNLYYDYIEEYGKIVPIYNDDGSITITDQLDSSIEGDYTLIQISLIYSYKLPVGKYYLYLEGTTNPILEDFDPENGYLAIKCNTTGVSSTYDIKIMIWQDTSVTTDAYELVEAPEGTVFEPYHEPYLQNAEVSKIESRGANIIRFPYGRQQQYPAGYTTTLNGVTYTVLEDGGIKRKGTATGYSQFVINSDGDAPKLKDGEDYCFSGITNISYYDSRTPNKVYIWTGEYKTWSEYYSIHNINIIVREGDTVDDVVYPMLNVGKFKLPYKPYREIVDTFYIPEAVRNLNGYGREGSYIKYEDGAWSLTVTKDEKLEVLANPEVTDITEYFTEDNTIKVESCGRLRFVNEHKQSVPNTIGYVKRKE